MKKFVVLVLSFVFIAGAQASAQQASTLQNQSSSSVQGNGSSLQNTNTQTPQGTNSLSQLTSGGTPVPFAPDTASVVPAPAPTEKSGNIAQKLLIALLILGALIIGVLLWGTIDKVRKEEEVITEEIANSTPKPKKKKTKSKRKKAHR